jgi:hypothetical protein
MAYHASMSTARLGLRMIFVHVVGTIHVGTVSHRLFISLERRLRQAAAHKLSGINLAIANAAEKAGFNVSNKKALMELVFAVRRAGGLGDYWPPPPPHPIYPDRYRPEKRRKEDDDELSEVVGSIGDHAVTAPGTSNNPINFDDEMSTGPTQPDPSAKRQRITNDNSNTHPARQTLINSRGSTRNRNSNRRPRRQHRAPTPALNHRQRRTPTCAQPSQHDNTIQVLLTVGQTIKENEDAIIKCVNEMETLWRLDGRMKQDELGPLLREMKNSFDLAQSGSYGAIIAVKDVLHSLGHHEIR